MEEEGENGDDDRLFELLFCRLIDQLFVGRLEIDVDEYG